MQYVVIIPVFAHEDGHKYALVHLKTHGPMGAQGVNGFGGKVEEGETITMALQREQREELPGLGVMESWSELGTISGEGWEVVFTRAYIPAPPPRPLATPELRRSFVVRDDELNDVAWRVPWAENFLPMLRKALGVMPKQTLEGP